MNKTCNDIQSYIAQVNSKRLKDAVFQEERYKSSVRLAVGDVIDSIDEFRCYLEDQLMDWNEEEGATIIENLRDRLQMLSKITKKQLFDDLLHLSRFNGDYYREHYLEKLKEEEGESWYETITRENRLTVDDVI